MNRLALLCVSDLSGSRRRPCARAALCAIVSDVHSQERYVEGGSRTTLVLLSLILVVAGVLARQAYKPDRSYRDAASRVARDYPHVAPAPPPPPHPPPLHFH